MLGLNEIEKNQIIKRHFSDARCGTIPLDRMPEISAINHMISTSFKFFIHSRAQSRKSKIWISVSIQGLLQFVLLYIPIYSLQYI